MVPLWVITAVPIRVETKPLIPGGLPDQVDLLPPLPSSALSQIHAVGRRHFRGICFCGKLSERCYSRQCRANSVADDFARQLPLY